MDWIDQKYIGLVSNRLQRFKRVNNTTFNFRCPLCGDSKTNKFKARGYIVEKPVVGTLYYCHNCHESISLLNFLKRVEPTLAEEYKRDKFIDKNEEQPVQKEEAPDISKVVVPTFLKGNSPLKQLKKISQLMPEHPVKKYVQKRKIPPELHYKLFYAPKFKEWVNTIVPEKFSEESLANDEPRLIIPFLDRDGNLFGFQGRGFQKDGIRYITIMIDQMKPKVFGLDTINEEGKIFVVEGPIDSMFLPNCVAMAGSSVRLDTIFPTKPKNELVVVMDNEPRNKQIVERIDKYIDEGYNVCIWPENVVEKDINDMVLAGLDPETIIQQNTFSGLTAKAKLTQWKKN